MKKNSVDPDDAPPLTGDEIARPGAKWRIAGKEVTPEQGKSAFRAALSGKTRINIHLDNDLIAYYRAKAGARGYQTLINSALRRDMETADLKAEMLKVIDTKFAQCMSQAIINASNAVVNANNFLQFRIWSGEELVGSTPTTNANSGTPIFGYSTPTQGNG
jgi:uncharacterized protein (DUF4415 family)